MLPDSLLKQIFSLKGNFAEGLRPDDRRVDGVQVAPFLHDRRAAVIISADFELNWAWRELAPSLRDAKGQLERTNFPYLVALFERTGVPVTWATVGHMFLRSCARGSDGRPHPEMPRPSHNDRWDGDWYIHDPCSDAAADPLWYSPDLIDRLMASSAPNEIASHSFSHIDFSASSAGPELIDAEIHACIGAMAPFGLRPRSLVYPFNKMGHHYMEVLARRGLVAVRHRDPRIRLSYPERTPSGIYKLYETLNLRRAKYYHYPQKARLFLREAVERRCAFHIWFHPSDSPAVFETVFAPIVEHIASLRDAGDVWCATMAEVAAYCEARNMVEFRVDHTDSTLAIEVDASRYDLERYGNTDITFVLPPSPQLRYVRAFEGGAWQQLETARTHTSGSRMVTVPIGVTLLEAVF